MDERGLKKLHAAAVHQREMAHLAQLAVERAEEKVQRFRELLAEAEHGLDAARQEAERADTEAAELEEKSSHWRNIERGMERVYAYADSADAQGTA